MNHTPPETEHDPRDTMDDLGMMRRADLWPRWPFLPVKRSPWDTGALLEDGESNIAAPIVYDPIVGTVLHRYESLEALVAARWSID